MLQRSEAVAGWQGRTGSQAAQQGTAGDQAPIKAPKEVICHSGVGPGGHVGCRGCEDEGGDKSRR